MGRMLHRPNWGLVAILLVCFAGVVCGGLGFEIDSSTNWAERLQTLWQVQAAIAAIALPLALVVTEFVRDERLLARRLPEVAMRSSGLLPTICYGFAGVVMLGLLTGWWANAWAYGTGLAFLTSTLALAVWAFSIILRLLFDRTKQAREAALLLHAEVAASVEQDVRERLGRELLNGRLQAAGIALWPPSDTDDYMRVVIRVGGGDESYVGNVYPDILGRCIEDLPRHAIVQNSTTGDVSSSRGPEIPERPVLLSRGYAQRVGTSAPLLLCIHRDAFETESVDEVALSRQLSRAFEVVGDDQLHGPLHRIREQLGHLRGLVMQAIKEESAPDVTDLLEEGYLTLIDAFLARLDSYRGFFGARLLQDGFYAHRDTWLEMELITDDLRSFLLLAQRRANAEVVRSLVRFVKTACIRVFRGNRDLPPDSRELTLFLAYFAFVYSTSERLAASDRSIIVDYIAQSLSELAGFYLLPRFEDSDARGRLELRRCFVTVLKTFSDLMKMAVDQSREVEIRIFCGALDGTIEHFAHYSKAVSAFDGPHFADEGVGDDLATADEQTDLIIADGLLGRLSVLFGLHAWLLGQFEEGAIDTDALARLRGELRLPLSPDQVWRLYLEAQHLENRGRDPFGWGWWEVHLLPGQITTYTPKFGEYLRTAMIVIAAEQMLSMTPEQRSGIQYQSVSELAHWMDQKGCVRQALARFRENGAMWRPIVGEPFDEVIDALEHGLQRAADVQQKYDDDQLIAAPLSAEKVKEMAGAVVDAWKNSGVARRVLGGSIRHVPGHLMDGRYLAIDRLDPKDLYAEGSETLAFGFADGYGHSLASGEDGTVFAQVAGTVSELNTLRCAENDLPNLVESAIEGMRVAGRQPIVVAGSARRSTDRLRRSPHFQPNFSSSDSEGTFLGVPVYQSHAYDQSCVLVIDPQRVEWSQYESPDLFSPVLEVEGLAIGIEAIDEVAARELIAQQPDLQRTRDGEEQSLEQAVRELQKRVRTRIAEQFVVEVNDQAAVTKIIVSVQSVVESL